VPRTDSLLLFFFFSVFGLYTVLSALTFSLYVKNPKIVPGLYQMFALLTAGPVYAFMPLFLVSIFCV
jgi:hypothetical protein